ncbi:MAG TPA: hypothetical protein PKM21_06030 [Anaerolineales bacterium]|nr:hypothetical protein [Anaerolineales bacterium]
MFENMEARFSQLYQQYVQRQISPQAFAQAVSQLRLVGPDGAWWQMDQNGAWLRWDGRGWLPAVPPRQPLAAQPGAPYQPPAQPYPAAPAYPAAPPQAQPASPYLAAMHPAARPAKRLANRPAKAQAKPPESLLDLLKLILGGMFKGFFTKLLMAIVTLLFVWVLHTILLIGPNGGFAGGTSWVLDAVLALQGKMANGTLFWGLFFGLLSMIAGRIWQLGFSQAVKTAAATPGWLFTSFKELRLKSLALVCGNAALTLIIGTIINNRLVALLLAVFGLVELTAQANSLPGLVSRLAWNDVQRLTGGVKRPFNPAWIAPAVVGLVLGFLGATVMPWVPWCGVGGALVLLALMGATVAMMILRPRAGTLMMVFLLIFFAAVTPALADDGGWEEAGGTLQSWLTSQGAVQAILQGLPPAAAAAILGWLSAVLGQTLGGLANIKPADLAAALATAQNLANLNTGLTALNQDLRNQGIYVRNFLQGDPILVFQGLYNLGGIIWDETAGRWTGAQGMTCGDYVDKTFGPVKNLVEQNFPGAKVQSIVFEEKSSNASGFWNGVDAINTENHNLIKVTMPDGSEWAVDFHQHNSTVTTSNAPPIMRPWSEARQIWENYLGKNEFTERVER